MAGAEGAAEGGEGGAGTHARRRRRGLSQFPAARASERAEASCEESPGLECGEEEWGGGRRKTAEALDSQERLFPPSPRLQFLVRLCC